LYNILIPLMYHTIFQNKKGRFYVCPYFRLSVHQYNTLFKKLSLTENLHTIN